MSPEMLTRSGHNRLLDFYALGALLFEMLTGLPPFYSKNRQEMYRRIVNDKIEIPSYVCNSAASLIKGLLRKNPLERLGAKGMEEVKAHPYLVNVNWQELLKKKITPPIKVEVRVSNFDPEYTSLRFSLNELGYDDNEVRSLSLIESYLEVNKKRIENSDFTITSSKEPKSFLKHEHNKEDVSKNLKKSQYETFAGFSFPKAIKPNEHSKLGTINIYSNNNKNRHKTSSETDYDIDTVNYNKRKFVPSKQVVLMKAVSLRGENNDSNLNLSDNESPKLTPRISNQTIVSSNKYKSSQEFSQYDTRKLIEEKLSKINGNIIKLNDEYCGIVSERKRDVKNTLPTKKVCTKRVPIKSKELVTTALKFKSLQNNKQTKNNRKASYRRVTNSVTEKYEIEKQNDKPLDNTYKVRVGQRISNYQTPLLKSASKDLDFTKVAVNGDNTQMLHKEVKINYINRVSYWWQKKIERRKRGSSLTIL